MIMLGQYTICCTEPATKIPCTRTRLLVRRLCSTTVWVFNAQGGARHQEEPGGEKGKAEGGGNAMGKAGREGKGGSRGCGSGPRRCMYGPL
ncbi:unnamed protein product [Arctogadus glacialis]